MEKEKNPNDDLDTLWEMERENVFMKLEGMTKEEQDKYLRGYWTNRKQAGVLEK